jgi:hypothetical protein
VATASTRAGFDPEGDHPREESSPCAPWTPTPAHTALREATQALSVRRDGIIHAGLTETGYQARAVDLARTLDAVVDLLRSVGVGAAPQAAAHGLLTVAEHLDMGAWTARQAGGDSDPRRVPRMRLDPERCATTDS